MSKKAAQPEPIEITPRCEYCKHNTGEDEKFRFMWDCKVLGCCVAFGYQRKYSEREEPQYCKAMFLGKGTFEVDREKYKDYKEDK